jgi:hypothetical protein
MMIGKVFRYPSTLLCPEDSHLGLAYAASSAFGCLQELTIEKTNRLQDL